MNIIFGNLVGDFNSYSVPVDSSPEDQFRGSVSRNSLYFVYLFIGKFVLTYISLFCFRTVGLRISAALRLEYLQALLSQPVAKLDEISAGTVVGTITTSANDIQASISYRLSGLFQSLALIVAAYAIAFKYSWALTLAVSSAFLFGILVMGATSPGTLKGFKRILKADERHATAASEAVSSIRTVFALGAESKMIAKHSEGVDASHESGLRVIKWVVGQIGPLFFTVYASYALAFWFGLKLYREGHISGVSNVIVVFFSVLLVTSVLGQIAHPIIAINKATAASTGIFDMIDSDKVRTDGLQEPEASANNDIELNDITFAYPTRPGVSVLTNFSAVLQKGKTTALVGPSGSGKSTVVGLLERWYSLHREVSTTPSENIKNTTDKYGVIKITETSEGDTKSLNSGSITVGGLNIDDLDLRWWRSQIGFVQQEPFLFNDTIENNIAYGLIGTIWETADETKKLELIKGACIEAFADEFIDKLPQGYSTRVGEGGIKLSGGQRQRIAIARAIVRQPAILILDEATSAIDVQGEKIVQAALDRASMHRTTIMIAHRLSTIRKADHIIVLRGGLKIEEGTHTELLSKKDGLYSGLVAAQRIVHKDDELESFQHDDSFTALKPEITHTSSQGVLEEVNSGTMNTTVAENQMLDSAAKKRGLVSSVGTLMYEQRDKWVLYLVSVLAAMGCGTANALQSWFFAQLIQTFQYIGQRLIDAANFWSLMFFILALSVTTCYVTLCVSCGISSTHVGTTCRRGYFRSALKMPISYFDREENASGSVMERLSSDPKQVQELLGFNSVFPFISIFNMIGAAIISFYFGWKLALVTFFAVMPVIVGASFLRMRYEVKFEKKNSAVFSSSSQFASEAVGAFRTVSALGMERIIIDKYKKLLAEQIKSTTQKSSYAMLFYAFTDSVELLAMALAFWYGGQLLASREYNAFQFFVIYSAVVQGSQAAGQYLSIVPNLAYAKASAGRILELRAQAEGSGPLVARTAISNTGSGAEIKFQDVTFQYAGLSTPLFCRLNIEIEAGTFVAFVGPSGCGKTTTISMLERFYDPVAGSIFVDGEDISLLDTRSYRKKLALVSQEPRLFSGTIRSNLLLGVDESTITEEQITQACKDAEIHDFIISLPDSYNTELGQNTQTALSGGQKQRLCLARALLRQPKLLLLDEATSSLDSQSEKLVQGAIERLAGQRSMTVIAVAHRLATIQKADMIFVFGERDTESNKGSKIVERGSHDELIAKRGIYWSMCLAQALDK